MTSEEYGQYIDDFELNVDVMPGESLTEYIERRRREFESKADGGSIGIEVLFTEKKPRKKFFMGGPALEGEALDIYTSMNKYGFSDQEIADALAARGLRGTTQPEQVTGIINQQVPTSSGRDDNKTGFGKFGNLDPTTEKTFIKDVYTIDKNAKPGDPMTGSFKPTEVTGYLNTITGNYQTFDGKNINHAGINAKPLIAMAFEAMGFGEPKNLTGLPYREGQIAGTFTGKNPFGLFKKQQEAIGIQNAAAAEAIRRAEAEAEAARKRKIATTPGRTTGGGGREVSTGAGAVAGARQDISNYQSFGEVPLADGGRVGLFMGGDPLTGQALQIYNSMNAYGFSDQEIAATLAERGLYKPGGTTTPTTTTPVINKKTNIINEGGGDGPPPPGPKTFDKGFSSLNFGLGRDLVNKDAVVDYEAEAYNVGPTVTGTFARALTNLKSIPTPFNIARMGIQKAVDFAKQKEREKKEREEAIARDAFREAMRQGRSFYDSLNEGRGASVSQASREQAGSGFGDVSESGPFKDGGLATMFTRRR